DESKQAEPFVVAIDGPAASGKGTLARRVAERFGLAHLDTGKLYRLTAYLILLRDGDPADQAAAKCAAAEVPATLLRTPTLAEGSTLQTEEVAQASSVVAAVPEVRAALLQFQRSFAAHPPGEVSGAVLDGRDIGSAICPDAPVKIFLTASLPA